MEYAKSVNIFKGYLEVEPVKFDDRLDVAVKDEKSKMTSQKSA